MKSKIAVALAAAGLVAAANIGAASARFRSPVLGCYSGLFGGGNWNVKYKPRRCLVVTDPNSRGAGVCADSGLFSNVRWSHWGSRTATGRGRVTLCHIPTLTLTLKANDLGPFGCPSSPHGLGSAYYRLSVRFPRLRDLNGQIEGPFTVTFNTTPADPFC
jgi:hypothetical protein